MDHGSTPPPRPRGSREPSAAPSTVSSSSGPGRGARGPSEEDAHNPHHHRLAATGTTTTTTANTTTHTELSGIVNSRGPSAAPAAEAETRAPSASDPYGIADEPPLPTTTSTSSHSPRRSADVPIPLGPPHTQWPKKPEVTWVDACGGVHEYLYRAGVVHMARKHVLEGMGVAQRARCEIDALVSECTFTPRVHHKYPEETALHRLEYHRKAHEAGLRPDATATTDSDDRSMWVHAPPVSSSSATMGGARAADGSGLPHLGLWAEGGAGRRGAAVSPEHQQASSSPAGNRGSMSVARRRDPVPPGDDSSMAVATDDGSPARGGRATQLVAAGAAGPADAEALVSADGSVLVPPTAVDGLATATRLYNEAARRHAQREQWRREKLELEEAEMEPYRRYGHRGCPRNDDDNGHLNDSPVQYAPGSGPSYVKPTEAFRVHQEEMERERKAKQQQHRSPTPRAGGRRSHPALSPPSSAKEPARPNELLQEAEVADMVLRARERAAQRAAEKEEQRRCRESQERRQDRRAPTSVAASSRAPGRPRQAAEAHVPSYAAPLRRPTPARSGSPAVSKPAAGAQPRRKSSRPPSAVSSRGRRSVPTASGASHSRAASPPRLTLEDVIDDPYVVAAQ